METRIGDRLKQLRLANALSLDGLALRMGGLVSKQALSKYERGLMCPSARVTLALSKAFGVKSAQLWGKGYVDVRFVAYRKTSRLGKTEQKRTESLVSLKLEERAGLQELVSPEYSGQVPTQSYRVATLADAEVAAEKMRERWELGLDAIGSVADILENHLVHVVEIDADSHFDGISAYAVDERGQKVCAAVAVRTGIPGERQRLSLAHELGHLVLNVSDDVDEEKAAFRFAGAFLVPAETLRREVGDKRRCILLDELRQLKKKFGISLQALLYRLRDLGVIGESHYEAWCRTISENRWRKSEPDPLPPEHPRWLRQNVNRALAEELISEKAAKRLLESVEVTEPQRLSISDRRKMMKQQAERLAQYYEEDTVWKEIEGSDIVEHY